MNDNFAHRAAEWDTSEKINMTDIFVNEMLQYIAPQSDWKALEIGAGTGLVGMQILSLVNKVVFEDTSAAMLDVLKQKLEEKNQAEILHGEVYDYNQKDIDLIFSCMALHHVPDIEKTLQHLSTITNPGAMVVIGDLKTEDGSFHRFEPIPHRGFDTDILSEQFRQAGFDVQKVHVYNILSRERIEGVIADFEQFILIAKKK
ncbi:MAG TPA: class I SAM-dependent methyltransferase [Paludibacter sp.]